ncbi:MAG: formyltransferase family protein, partial [Candidatus Gastranaerophilales bacterium]|nr:formyltransferase family protein [Candidatus Gastranaerophilales bacterium]
EKRLDEPEFIEKVRAKDADVGIVASFNKKFPKVLLESTKMGFINSHPSLLPLYRGGNPYFYPIFNNDPLTGITLHFMDEEFDTGDIIFQKSVNILPFETMGTLFNRTNFMFAQAHVDLVSFLEEGKTLPRKPQDKEGRYQTADMLHEYLGDTKINWAMSAELIERFVRACNPFLGAMSFYKGNPVKFYSGVVDSSTAIKDPPGQIVQITDTSVGISTGKGIYYPTAMQVGSYFSSDVTLFLQFVKPQIGDSFD